MKRFASAFFIAIFFLLPLASAQFPAPVGFVNDFAGILSDPVSLNNALSAYERNTTIEMVIVTISELPSDHTTATYANELFQEWGIGKQGEDNGILVLIVENGSPGSRMRIELGYGTQGYITGAESGRILDAALPFYTEGDYQRAAEVIVAGLQLQLSSYIPGEIAPRLTANQIWDLLYAFLPFIFIFAFFAFQRDHCPNCGSRERVCHGDHCVCKKCGKRYRRKRSYFLFVPFGMGGHGGGFGGFGGGMSGGGGAGR